MEDELWMRKIKERLDDYSEPLPVSGWERLEKDLSVSKPPVAGKRRIIPFRRWAVAAAAALLVAVSSVSVWLLQSPVGEEMRNMTAPALAAVPDRLPEQQTPSVRTEITEPDYRAQKQESPADTNRRSLLAQQLNTVDETERETAIQSLGAEPEVQTGNAQKPTAESARVNQEAAEERREEERTEKIERRRRGNAHCGQQGDEGKHKADGTLSYGFRLFLCTSDQAPREIGVAVQAGERRIQRAAQTTVFPKFIHANASFPALSEGLDGPAQGAPRR